MRAWILIGSLAAAVGAAACGTQAATQFAGQGTVRCEPGQHAVVNQSVIDGGTVTSVSCAADVLAPFAAPARAGYTQQAFQSQPVAYQPAPAARPAVLRSEAPVERKAKRSWQKRALVIGGSSGAGAGIGALIGGKKGALIGAAIGAGGGTVYEMQKK